MASMATWHPLSARFYVDAKCTVNYSDKILDWDSGPEAGSRGLFGIAHLEEDGDFVRPMESPFCCGRVTSRLSTSSATPSSCMHPTLRRPLTVPTASARRTRCRVCGVGGGTGAARHVGTARAADVYKRPTDPSVERPQP